MINIICIKVNDNNYTKFNKIFNLVTILYMNYYTDVTAISTRSA